MGEKVGRKTKRIFSVFLVISPSKSDLEKRIDSTSSRRNSRGFTKTHSENREGANEKIAPSQFLEGVHYEIRKKENNQKGAAEHYLYSPQEIRSEGQEMNGLWILFVPVLLAISVIWLTEKRIRKETRREELLARLRENL